MSNEVTTGGLQRGREMAADAHCQSVQARPGVEGDGDEGRLVVVCCWKRERRDGVERRRVDDQQETA